MSTCSTITDISSRIQLGFECNNEYNHLSKRTIFCINSYASNECQCLYRAPYKSGRYVLWFFPSQFIVDCFMYIVFIYILTWYSVEVYILMTSQSNSPLIHLLFSAPSSESSTGNWSSHESFVSCSVWNSWVFLSLSEQYHKLKLSRINI